MDHQAAHHDVVRAVRGVEGFGDPIGERAVVQAGDTAGVHDRLAGRIHALGVTTGRDGFGHRAGEVSRAAADVENPVPWTGTALGDQPGDDTASTAAKEDRCEHVVAASASAEPAGVRVLGSPCRQSTCSVMAPFSVLDWTGWCPGSCREWRIRLPSQSAPGPTTPVRWRITRT